MAASTVYLAMLAGSVAPLPAIAQQAVLIDRLVAVVGDQALTWRDVQAARLLGSIPTSGTNPEATERLVTRPDPQAVVLGAADVPDMLALVERSRPGPFEARTYLLGRYVGFRDDAGRLVAMAGERLHPAGWTEISAVTTDHDHRGRGLASRLVRDVAFHVQERGDRAFLHAAAENTGAIGVYERLGFALRRRTSFGSLLAPA